MFQALTNNVLNLFVYFLCVCYYYTHIKLFIIIITFVCVCVIMFVLIFQHGGKKRELGENTEEAGTPCRKRTRVDVGGL